MKILVVEDDAVQRGVIVATLKASGNEVIEAASGEAAIEAVEKADALDLVLMDLRMPGMGGMETLDRIRALSGWRKHVTVKAISARSLSRVEDEAFDGFVPKGGGNLSVLLSEALRDAVSRAAASDTPAAAAGERRPWLAWVRANLLAIAAMIIAALSGGLSSLVTSAVNVTNVGNRLSNLETASKHAEERDAATLAQSRQDVAELNKRGGEMFNALQAAIADANRRADSRAAEMLSSMSRDVADAIGRVDALDRRTTDQRHDRDTEASVLRERLGVLEAQVRFLVDRMDLSNRNIPPPPAGKRP